MKRIAIILNGTPPTGQALLALAGIKYDAYMAVDGGYKFCKRNNIRVDYFVGDFDSSKKDASFDNVKVLAFSSDKDATDGELAADIAIVKGASHIDFYGGGGKPTDHLLGNLNVLFGLSKEGISARMINNGEVIYIINNTLMLGDIGGSLLSLLPFTDKAIVSIDGVKYPLQNQELTKDNTLGVSNRGAGQVNIKVSKGYVMVIVNSLKHLF